MGKILSFLILILTVLFIVYRQSFLKGIVVN